MAPISVRLIFRRLYWMLTSGFRGHRGRAMTRFVIIQWLSIIFLIFLWIKYNGGIWPWFLPGGGGSRQSREGEGARETDVNPLDYFTSSHHDAALIRWTDSVNTRDAVLQAVTATDVMMMTADVNSDGSIPLMCGVPLVRTAMTFDTWLDIARHRRKGFRLRFHSLQAVEAALRKLRFYRDELRMPIQLSAVVVGTDPPTSTQSPPTQDLTILQPVLMPDLFLRLAVTQFPPSTLMLSWSHLAPSHSGAISPRASDAPRERFDWADVKQMYDIVEKWQLKQPVGFAVGNATIVRRSVSQLKWLMELTGGSLSVRHRLPGLSNVAEIPVDGKTGKVVEKQVSEREEKEATITAITRELLKIRQHFPAYSVYYDLDPAVAETFQPIRDERADDGDDRTFSADQWKVVRSREGERIYLGTEAVLMQSGLLLTKEEHLVDKERGNVIIEGRVEFLDDPTEDVENSVKIPEESAPKDDVGLAVFLRATQSSRPDSISGIRCFISAGKSGRLRIETRGVPGADEEVSAIIPGTAPCFLFTITDSGSGEGSAITMNVTRPRSCDEPKDSGVDFSSSLSLPMHKINTEAGYIAIRQSPVAGNQRGAYTAVDQFVIKRTRKSEVKTAAGA